MNCNDARKHLHPFADGELPAPQSEAVSKHIAECPQCEQSVRDQKALRAVVCKVIEREPVPEELKSKINAAVMGAVPVSAPSVGGGVFSTRLRAYSMAACILLVAGLFLWRSAWQPGTPPGGVNIREKADAVPQFARMVSDVHDMCCAHGPNHHAKSLPTKLAALEPAICSHFHNKIKALAPDLTSHGYRFESANYCGVQEAPEAAGGHLIYAHETKPVRLSFFSIPQWDELGGCMTACSEAAGCRQCEVPQKDGKSLAILTWTKNGTTYVCCGAEPVSVIASMFSQARLAMARIDDELGLTLMLPRR